MLRIFYILLPIIAFCSANAAEQINESARAVDREAAGSAMAEPKLPWHLADIPELNLLPENEITSIVHSPEDPNDIFADLSCMDSLVQFIKDRKLYKRDEIYNRERGNYVNFRGDENNPYSLRYKKRRSAKDNLFVRVNKKIGKVVLSRIYTYSSSCELKKIQYGFGPTIRELDSASCASGAGLGSLCNMYFPQSQTRSSSGRSLASTDEAKEAEKLIPPKTPVFKGGGLTFTTGDTDGGSGPAEKRDVDDPYGATCENPVTEEAIRFCKTVYDKLSAKYNAETCREPKERVEQIICAQIENFKHNYPNAEPLKPENIEFKNEKKPASIEANPASGAG